MVDKIKILIVLGIILSSCSSDNGEDDKKVHVACYQHGTQTMNEVLVRHEEGIFRLYYDANGDRVTQFAGDCEIREIDEK